MKISLLRRHYKMRIKWDVWNYQLILTNLLNCLFLLWEFIFRLSKLLLSCVHYDFWTWELSWVEIFGESRVYSSLLWLEISEKYPLNLIFCFFTEIFSWAPLGIKSSKFSRNLKEEQRKEETDFWLRFWSGNSEFSKFCSPCFELLAPACNFWFALKKVFHFEDFELENTSRKSSLCKNFNEVQKTQNSFW